MAADADSDPMGDFQSSLNDLSFNSKPLINMLTMLSEDYKDTKATQIVKIIEKRLHSVVAEKKLPVLYLLDSVCKNVGKPYTELFTQNIVSNFCDVFEKVDEKTRLSLYKLRQTWSSIFPIGKLYAIDTRIKSKLDPAWPITAKPKPEANNTKPELKSVVKPAKPTEKSTSGQSARQQQVHINPKFLNEKALPPISSGDSQSAELAKQLIQKQNELLQIQKQKLEYDVMMQKRKLEEQARALQEKEMKLKQKEQQMARSSSPNSKKREPKKRKRSRSQRSRSPSPSPRQKSKSPPRNQNSPRWTQNPNKRDGHRGRSPQVAKPFIPHQSVSQPAVSASHSSVILPTSSMSGHGGQPTVQTTIPAPTILAQPEMLNISRMDSSVVTTMSSMGPITNPIAHNAISSHMNNSIDRPVAWPQDRDYRKELDSMIGQANEKLRAGAISVADHNVLVREMERSLRDTKGNHFNNTNSGVNSELKEPSDTFTMPVDGKFRKLYYLDDTTAVVLLNAPPNASFEQLARRDPRTLDPRQISFEGNPTYIHIDNDRHTGETMLMDFNGQEYVHIPRVQDPSIAAIPQRIKFGGPGKEIILNGQPYPAKFSGPPIQVWFEGDRTGPHSIQLDGPTPRVKLSDQRRYDLWNEVINRASNDAKSVMNKAPAQQPSDINNLLSKLIAAGMIDNKSQNNSPKATIASPKEETYEPEPRHKSQKSVSKDPPITLTSESLKIARPSVVAALYRGIQCTNCSLRFDDKTSEDKTKYSKHLDWHFRQNRRDKAKPNSSAASLRRNWYYPLNLWLQFKEVTYEEDTTGLFQNEENEMEEQEAQPISTVVAEKDESLNCCAVCGEKFDQQWNEDHEEWRLQNAIKHTDNRIYHPLCLNDIITQTQRLAEQQLNEDVSDHEMANISEESIKIETKEETNEMREEFNKLENELSETLARLSDDQNNDMHEKMETNEEVEVKPETNEVSEVTDVKEELPVVNELEQSDNTPEQEEDDTNIKVIELEIPINSDNNQVNHDLTNIFENRELIENIEEAGSETKESSDEPKADSSAEKPRVVHQTGGIVIKMKASNLQTPASAPAVAPAEPEEGVKPEVIVRGKELSSLCTIS